MLFIKSVYILLAAFVAAKIQRLIAVTNRNGVAFINIRSADRILNHFSRFYAFFPLFGLLFSLFLAVIHEQPIENITDQRKNHYLNKHTLS